MMPLVLTFENVGSDLLNNYLHYALFGKKTTLDPKRLVRTTLSYWLVVQVTRVMLVWCVTRTGMFMVEDHPEPLRVQPTKRTLHGVMQVALANRSSGRKGISHLVMMSY